MFAVGARASLCKHVAEQGWAECRSPRGERRFAGRSSAFPTLHVSHPSSSLGKSTGGFHKCSSTCPNMTKGLHPPSGCCRTPRAVPPCSGMMPRWGTSSQRDTGQLQATSAAGSASKTMLWSTGCFSPHRQPNKQPLHDGGQNFIFFNTEINLKVERKSPPNNKYYAFMK